MNINADVTYEHIAKALKILIDNGIEDDEAEVVLQAIGYALLDVQLFPNVKQEAGYEN